MTPLGFLLCAALIATVAYRVGRAAERVERDSDWRLWLCDSLRMNYCDVLWVEPTTPIVRVERVEPLMLEG